MGVITGEAAFAGGFFREGCVISPMGAMQPPSQNDQETINYLCRDNSR
jgi:hypothetical protein